MGKKGNTKKQTSKKDTAKKTTVKKEEIKKPFNKTYIAIFAVIIVICIIGIAWFMTGSETVKAQLVIDSGSVEVKHEGGSWASAENGMLLYQSDSVKTGDDSSASIILFESSIIRLDSNTEVLLEEIIQEEETSVTIQQESGRTWNTVRKISGIDNYDVQTPTTVASVRGTAFVVIVQENGSTYYGVEHGILNVSSVSNDEIQDVIDVSGDESVIIYVDLVHKSLEIKPFEKDDWVLENINKDEQFKTDLKEELYTRLEPYIPELKSTYGVTDQELEILIDGYLAGEFDLPENTPQWIRDIIELS